MKKIHIVLAIMLCTGLQAQTFEFECAPQYQWSYQYHRWSSSDPDIHTTYVIRPAPAPLTGYIAEQLRYDSYHPSANYIGARLDELHARIRRDIEGL